MKLVILTAILAVSGAAKLDRTYLPPPSAASAGGNSASLQTPFTRSSDEGSTSDLPSGSYTNSFQGIVVEAAAPGTRASSDSNQSGLGGHRDNYGSTNSKVGEAAFRGSLAGFRTPQTFGSSINSQVSNVGGGFETKPERPQAFKDRNSNIVSYSNEVSVDNYSYGFESDNGIAVGENGVANDGIQAQGGYSYMGDDGQVYKVTYTADEGGYRPQGNHLPTPPPIPKEILMSLEQNAKEEAAGISDDGSYDAQKYNAAGDYSNKNGDKSQYNGAQLSQPTKRPLLDATASGTFINQNSQAFEKPSPGQLSNFGSQSSSGNYNGQFNQVHQFDLNHSSGNSQNGITASQNKRPSQLLNGSHKSSSTSLHSTSNLGQTSGNPLTSQFSGIQGSSQLLSKNNQQQLTGQLGSLQPQSSFGQSTQNLQYQGSLVAAQNQELNKPSFNALTFNNGRIPNNSVGTTNINGNRFPSVQNNFGSGYLPPLSSSIEPGNSNQQTGNIVTNQEINKNNPNLNTATETLSKPFQGFQQISSASAFTSSGQPGIESQPSIPVNSFLSQTSYKPASSLFNLSDINSPKTQDSNSNAFSSTSQNSELNGLFAGNSNNVLHSKPTIVPEIELTTPLEPNEKPLFSQISPLNSQSNNGNFNSKPQGQSVQFRSQNTNVNSQQSGHTVFSSFPTAFSQSSSSPTLSSFTNQQHSVISPSNSITQNQPNNVYYSTPKPFNQGPDNSYYYNQPSKPFNTPEVRPQGSRFPNTPSYQSNGIASQSNKFSNQQNPLPEFSNIPSTPTFASVIPTSSSQFSKIQEISSTNYNNGVTQADISPFPSVSPTLPSSQLDSTQTGRYGSSQSILGQSNQFLQFGKPVSTQTPSAIPHFFPKPITNFGQKPFTQNQNQFAQSGINNNQPSTSQIANGDTITENTFIQEYQGTVYQYNKPEQSLPPPAQSGESESQNSNKESSTKPQFVQTSQPSRNEGQNSQLGSQQTQFLQNGYQNQQTTSDRLNKHQFGTQPFKPFGGAAVTSTQFDQNIQSSHQSSPTSIQSNEPNGFTSVPTLQQIHSPQLTHGNMQTFQPFGTAQSTTASINQNTPTSFGSQSAQQFGSQTSQPFGSTTSQSTQGSFSSERLTQQNVEFNGAPFKPFGNTQMTLSFKPACCSSQNIPSKPQISTQTIQSQFGQTQQQLLGTTQPASETQAIPNKPSTLSPSQGSPDSSKPFFGQNAGSILDSKPAGSTVGQIFQSSQLGSSSSQTLPGQQNASPQQFGTAPSSQTFQGYKPSRPSSFNYQSQIEPQAPVSQSGLSATGSTSFSTQQFNSQVTESSPTPNSAGGFNTDQPSQTLGQSQSQLTGFQAPQQIASAQSFAGKGEEFGGPREPPRFDTQTGYHY